MNLTKVLLIAVAAGLLLGGWMFFTRTDRSDPIAVATAFTKALKAKNTSKASDYIVPDQAKAWQTAADATMESMKSGTLERFYEGIPDKPAFSAPTTTAGVTTIASEDKTYVLGLTQINGKWYISKGPI